MTGFIEHALAVLGHNLAIGGALCAAHVGGKRSEAHDVGAPRGWGWEPNVSGEAWTLEAV